LYNFPQNPKRKERLAEKTKSARTYVEYFTTQKLYITIAECGENFPIDMFKWCKLGQFVAMSEIDASVTLPQV
jgi:hypothetical protein